MNYSEKFNFVNNEIKGMKEFNLNLDKTRKALLYPQFPNCIKKEYQCLDDMNLCESGEYCCKVEGIEFHFLLQKKKVDKLYIFLNGAQGFNQKELKKYHRWSWANIVNACVVNILDPMYFKYENLPIGWYWGEKNLDYRELMARLIKKIANKLEISYSNIILYGSSAGGTAAIYTAHFIPKSTAVALNSQIRPWKHEWNDIFTSIVGIDTKNNDKFFRNDIAWHIDNSKDCKYIFITNCRSRRDFNWQLIPLSQHYNFDLCYGFNKYNNIYTWIFDTGTVNKHSALDYPAIFLSIDSILTGLKKNEPIKYLNAEVILINEFWREHWELMNR